MAIERALLVGSRSEPHGYAAIDACVGTANTLDKDVLLGENVNMAKEISCINAGFEDCPFLIRSEDPEEVAEVAMRHAERSHGVETTREHAERIMVDV